VYQIGAFSKMAGMSVKTLRYYHEIGLLEPAYIDDSTGYRYYTESEFLKAERIRFLKGLQFSLPEITEVLDHLEDESDLQAYLKEKKDQLELQIRELRKVQGSIQSHLDQEDKFMRERHYDFEIKEVPDQLVVSLRYKGRYDEMGTYIGKLFKAAGASSSGPPFALYYDESYMEDGADIEVCLPVKKPIDKKGVTSRTIPGSKYLVTRHIGPYEALSYAYKAMQDALNERGLTSHQPTMEVYEKGPGMLLKGNPDKYRTLIMFPVQA